MCGRNGADDFDVYCDMETDGGGWTLVANINPVDDNLVGKGTVLFSCPSLVAFLRLHLQFNTGLTADRCL